jgi:UDPglucose--hexose-1-phosphate uridylyltransferase
MLWEERWHPLRREWIIVSSHRNDRPWQGETIGDTRRDLREYEPGCYLCPGNSRVSGTKNPDYTGVFVFDNDHPCVSPSAPAELETPVAPYQNRPAKGLARVVCFTPRHDLTLAELSYPQYVALLETLQEQYRELSSHRDVEHVLMFENKGEAVGVSNPHPHCQIYATNFVFKTLETELDASAAHWEQHGKRRSLFQDIIAAEEQDGRRLLARREGAVSFIPYFARYPYETFVAPRTSHANIAGLEPAEIRDLATVLQETLIRLENLWRVPLPYVMVLHQAPVKFFNDGRFHFHIEIHPPLRKPGLLKYLAGPEIGGGNFLNDTSPEEKAAELQAVSNVHYKHETANA